MVAISVMKLCQVKLTYHKFSHIPPVCWSDCHYPNNHHKWISHTDQSLHCRRFEWWRPRRDQGLAPVNRHLHCRYKQPLEGKEWSHTALGWVYMFGHLCNHHLQCCRMAHRRLSLWHGRLCILSWEDNLQEHKDLNWKKKCSLIATS